MAWTTPVPPAVSAFRDMLVACPSAVTFGLVQARFHYPKASMSGASGATRPHAEIDELNSVRDRYAEQGVIGNPSGTLICTIHSESTISTMEELSRNLCSELLAQSTGLPIRSANAGRASDPTPGARAADATTATNTAAFTSITLTVEWGLSP